MKKTISITLIVLLGLALFFSSAFAFGTTASLEAAKPTAKPNKTPEVEQNKEGQSNKPAKKQTGKKYNINGVVVSYTNDSLVLTDKRGETVTVALNADTLIKTGGPKGSPVEIQADMKVAVQAVKAEDQSYLALRITVVPGKPLQVHRMGEVTAYDGTSITVKDNKGSTTFQIATDVKILPEERAGDLKVGARVTIISPRDPAGETVVAKGIVVHPAK